ncbi:MAG: hypothetical protein U1F16_00580 [Turneriella sp.]
MTLITGKLRFYASLTLILSLIGSACAGGQIRTDMELEEAARRAAAGEESGWRSLERTLRIKDEDADLEMQKKALTAAGRIKSPRAEALCRENLNHRQLRGEAAYGLVHQRNEANKDQIDAALVEAARRNAQEYGGLTRDEIRALGESDHPEAVRLLKQQIGRDPNKDEATVEALGKILLRKGKTAVDAVNPQRLATIMAVVPGGVALSLIAANISVEDISTSTGEASSEPEKESPDDLDPEKVLLQFLASDASPEVKDKAVQSVAAAHGGGSAYVLKLAARRNLPVGARISLVDYLTRFAVNNQDRSMINKFYALKRSAAGQPKLIASINLSIRLMGSAFGRAVATGGGRVYRVVESDGYDPLPKETDVISLKQRPYPGYSGADVKTNLKKALTYYRLDPSISERMQRRVSELLNEKDKKQSPERNLIFAALSRLYPDKDFYVLKKQGQDAFGKPGYFTTTLRLVTASQRGRSWQIAALQRLWNLSANEADLIRQIYLRDGKLLQQRMRL